MKLGASNLAWASAVDDEAFEMIAAAGFTGVEVAPTRIAAWADITLAGLALYRQRLEQAGLGVSSLQAIFYGRPELQLLGDPACFAEMCEHIRRVGGIAAALGAAVAVFGAPANRRRGERQLAEATGLATIRLRLLGDIAAAEGLMLGIEPVPPCYGADFLIRADDVAALVTACQHPAIRLHLDCACIALAGDDPVATIRAYGGMALHYHAAEPNLGSFDHPTCDHAAAAMALAAAGYGGWVVIEMRQQRGDGLGDLKCALSVVQAAYNPS